MKLKLLLSLLLALSTNMTVNAQVTVSGANPSSNGPYTKLSVCKEIKRTFA